MKYSHIDIFFLHGKVHTVAPLWVSILFLVTQSRSHTYNFEQLYIKKYQFITCKVSNYVLLSLKIVGKEES